MATADTMKSLRLWSGLILFAYVIVHLGNLALGLHSLDMMDRWRLFLLTPWRTLPGEILLAAAALIHTALGLYALGARRSLAQGGIDGVQLVLGLLIPPLLISHILAFKVSLSLVEGFVPSYAEIMALYWKYAPLNAIQQLFVLVAVWIHAAIGLYRWLILKPIWPRIAVLVVPVLFLVPILALLGFAQAGREVVERLATSPDFKTFVTQNSAKLAAINVRLAEIHQAVLIVYGTGLMIALAALAVRLARNRSKTVRIAYDGGFQAEGRVGLSILELSLLGDVPHAHVCSGRGRCGTCRVTIEEGASHLSPPSASELETLAHHHAAPGMRLACQALVHGPLRITRVLPAYADAASAREDEAMSDAAAVETACLMTSTMRLLSLVLPLIASAPAGAAEKSGMAMRAKEMLAAVDGRLDGIVAALAATPSESASLYRMLASGFESGEGVRAITSVLILLLVGGGIEWFYWMFAIGPFRLVESVPVRSPRHALGLGLRRFMLGLLGVLAFALSTLIASTSFTWATASMPASSRRCFS